MSAANDVSIRKLLPHESAAYRSMRLESLQQCPAFFGTTYAEEAAITILPFEYDIQEENPSNFMLGAFVDTYLCGICGFKREARQRTRHRGELVQMYVRPNIAGRGIGGRIVAGVLGAAYQDPELKQIILGVMVNNSTAINMYRRAGFREYGKLDHYFLHDDISSSQLFMVHERI